MIKSFLTTAALTVFCMQAIAAPKQKTHLQIPDRRILIDRSLPKYAQLNAIGLVSVKPGLFRGTGFLASRCAVVTNLHVAFLDPSRDKVGQSVYFSVGQPKQPKTGFEYPNILGIVIARGSLYDSKNGESTNFDWAVIRLTRSVGDQVGVIPILQMDVGNMIGLEMMTAGYAGDKNSAMHVSPPSDLFADPKCTVHDLQFAGFLEDTCQIAPGDSGSPIMLHTADNKYHAIGMVSASPLRYVPTDAIDSNNYLFSVGFYSFLSPPSSGMPSEGDKIVEAIKTIHCN